MTAFGGGGSVPTALAHCDIYPLRGLLLEVLSCRFYP